MDHTKWLLIVVNEALQLARKSSINFKTHSYCIHLIVVTI